MNIDLKNNNQEEDNQEKNHKKTINSLKKIKKLTKKKRQRNYGKLVISILEWFADALIETRSLKYGNFYAMMGEIIKEILKKNKKIKNHKLRRAFRQLEKRKLILIEEKDGKAYVYLQKKGKEFILKYSLKKLLDFKKKEKKWDGRWFMVFFDVPEKERLKRDYLRKFLKQIGFYQYQKSVYVFPYECEEEVALIKKIIAGGKYLSYIIAQKIDREIAVKRFFSIK